MQRLEFSTAAIGIALGGLAGWLWHRVHLRLGQDDFWRRFARVAKCVISDDSADRFLRSYCDLLTGLAAYVGKKLLALAAVFLPIAIIVTLLGPFAIEQWMRQAKCIEVFPKQHVTVTLEGRRLTLDRHTCSIPLRSDVSVAATFTTDYCVVHSASLTRKVAVSSSAIERLLFLSLGFDVRRVPTRRPGDKRLLVVRPSCGDGNVLWPYLNDLEFTFLVALTFGSVVGWPLSWVMAK